MIRSLAGLFLSVVLAAAEPPIVTIAGGGQWLRRSIDGKIANKVQFGQILYSLIDARGQVVFATDQAIVRVAHDGTLEVIAGGTPYHGGLPQNNVAGTSAYIERITSLSTD